MTGARGTVALHATTAGMDPAALRAGTDLVLDVAPAHGTALERGVLADDYLDVAMRAAVDAAANEAVERWRERFDAHLTHGGVSLAEVWHSELLADVFLPVVRAAVGVRAAIRAAPEPPGTVRCHGVGPARRAALTAALAPMGVRVEDATGEREDTLHPHYGRAPLSLATLPVRLMDLIGVPSRVRGDVLVVAYGTTVPVLERLAEGQLRPVVHGGMPPAGALALRAGRRGGWTGRPGALARGRASRATKRMLANAWARRAGLEVAGLELGTPLTAGALSYLRRRAAQTPAWLDLLDRALGGGSVRAVLLPFDWDPPGHVVVAVARRHRIPTLCLQHGYEPGKIFAPGGISDHTGVWSAWDVQAWPPERRPRTRIVGDPRRSPVGAVHGRRDGTRLRAVVLFQHPYRASAQIDGRVTALHAGVAVEGLRAALPDADIVLRPHPSDDRAAVASLADGLGVRFDATTPVRDLLGSADVCVGSTSTAALESALVGTPVVMLDPIGGGWTPPLNGTGGVPFARDAAELAALLPGLIGADPLPGRAALLEALGNDVPDPAGAIVAWLAELVAGVR